jgi:hypothetical protein
VIIIRSKNQSCGEGVTYKFGVWFVYSILISLVEVCV